MNSRRTWLALLFILFICIGIEIFVEMKVRDQITSWYNNLRLPVWAQAGRSYGPTWTVIYGLMALSLWLVWQRQQTSPSESYATSYLLFGIQLFLISAWAILFFQWHALFPALLCLWLLWLVLLLTIMSFYRHSAIAAWLLIPYHLWVTYAVTVNAAVYWLN